MPPGPRRALSISGRSPGPTATGTFASAEAERSSPVGDRAWTTGDGPRPLFVGAVVWLRVRRHLNVHGHYSFQLRELAGRRALRDPDSPEDGGE